MHACVFGCYFDISLFYVVFQNIYILMDVTKMNSLCNEHKNKGVTLADVTVLHLKWKSLPAALPLPFESQAFPSLVISRNCLA